MNVDLACWNWSLLTILQRISTSYAVSFDLELSGIPVRKRGTASGRQTLQDRYAEVKQAAETFHILQFGITLIEEDAENKRYVLRSYNFNLNPLVEEGLGIDRNFTYSSGAVKFLMDHGYKMESPFTWGIRYLTKQELAEAKENFTRKNDRSSIPDVNIKHDDTVALAFMQRARDEIKLWVKDRKKDDTEYLITAFSGRNSGVERDEGQLPPFGAFQRRLVHQIVRADFPNLITYGRKDSVSVQDKDPKAAADDLATGERKLRSMLFEQRSFNFITEALVGGSLEGIDTDRVGRRIMGEPPIGSTKDLEKRLDKLQASLKEHKAVLVGHNCFLDLVYIYKTFYGNLPNTVEEFQTAVHAIFPMIIDTKYVATALPTDGNRAMQLFEIAEAVSGWTNPQIDDAEDHVSYLATPSYHEAGFDSYATAKVFLRLCGKLDAIEVVEPLELKPSGQVAKTHDNSVEPTEIVPTEESSVSVETRKRKKSKRKGKSDSSENETRFSHSNAFDALQDLEDGTIPVSAETAASTSNAEPSNIMKANGLEIVKDARQDTRTLGTKLLPSWETDFWSVYGNKLRVFGTQEEVCELGKSSDENVKDDKGEKQTPETPAGDDVPTRQASSSLWEMVTQWKK